MGRGEAGLLPRAALLALLLLSIVPPRAAGAAPRWLGAPAAGIPQRVVSLAPSITEIFIELGAADRLVGVTRFDEAPEVAHCKRVGGYVDPSAEAVAALQPDLLVVQPSPGNRGAVERLAHLGIPVLVLPLTSLAEVKQGIVDVAEVLGLADRGRKLHDRMDQELAAIAARVAGRERVRALIVYNWQPLVVAGPDSYAAQILELAGGAIPAGLQGAFPTLPAEVALASRPRLVLDASGGHRAGTPPPGFAGKIRPLRASAFFRPGPKVAEAARELVELLHPEAHAPPQGGAPR